MGVPVRLALLLLLFPLSALASCPTGIQLSNLPIGTSLPMCIKFESSSLGGCNAGCPGVCVELPSSGTMGPIQTLGTECTYGNGGGDDGGNGNGDPFPITDYIGGPLISAPPTIVGPSTSTNLAPAFDALSGNVRRVQNAIEQGRTRLESDLSFIKDDLSTIAFNTQAHPNGDAGVIRLLHSIDGHLSMISQKTVLDPSFWSNQHNERQALLWDYRKDTSYAYGELQSIRDAIIKNGTGGGSGGNSGSGDLASIQAMMQSSMSTIGSISGNTSSVDNNLRRMSGDLGSIASTVNSLNSTSSSQLGQVIGSLASINGMMRDSLNNGGGSAGGDGGGTGNNEPGSINYDKMPGSLNNPMFMAASQYEPFCESQDCYFDIDSIEQEYKGKQKELTDKYQEIGDDVKEIFDYSLSGNAEVPKCFELYSFNNKTYSVCPDASGYWETLAAILLFLFYMVALMIIFRR
jgi:hypothetical protein